MTETNDHTLGTEDRPLRVAIIGAGPAGFFAAQALLKQKKCVVDVDLFDRLPAPYGLVRYGVAPDHPEIKRVRAVYEATASHPRFRFFGNVEFGGDLDHDDITSHYDQVVYTVGAQTDRQLNIPGEDLDGSFSATEFVAWYNGHPDYADRTFDLSHENAVVIGAGNVAMDVTRILAKDPEELENTDIADHALEVLRESKVENIYVLARRGPVQAKFTTPEIKEFGDLKIAQADVLHSDLELDEHSEAALEKSRVAKRNVRVLTEYADAEDLGKPRSVRFRFLVSPVEILPDKDGHVNRVRVRRNVLEPTETDYINAVGTDEIFEIPCGLFLRSVGYRGVPLPGVPFEERRGTIPNEEGRVVDPVTGQPVPGEYVAGWCKRGPSGVIGTNKGDAVKTVRKMLEDVPQTAPVTDEHASPEAIPELLSSRDVRFISFEDWQRIDAVEKERGGKLRPRVKIVTIEEMLECLED